MSNKAVKFVRWHRMQVFIDQGALSRMNPTEMTDALATVYGVEYPPVAVANLRQFFSLANLEKELIEPGEHVPYLLADRGVEVTADDLAILRQATEVRKRLLAEASAKKTEYPFAQTPEGWSLERDITIKQTVVTKGNYSIGKKTLKKIWDAVAPIWAGIRDEGLARGTLMYVDASGYRGREVVVKGDVIRIGCQEIQRYELEQVAQALEWDFPKEA